MTEKLNGKEMLDKLSYKKKKHGITLHSALCTLHSPMPARCSLATLSPPKAICATL